MSTNQSLFEKLELLDEKNLLIQGLPSGVEKLFAKLSYAKNVTPLLKTKKVDFALVFVVNQNQLNNVLKEVFSALHSKSKLWVAFPKQTSKIVCDLNRECSWEVLTSNGFEGATLIAVDHMWNAMRFVKTTAVEATVVSTKPKAEPKPKTEKVDKTDFDKSLVHPPVELEKVFAKHTKAKEVFVSLSQNNQKEFVTWIEGAKKQETRLRRSEVVVEKLMAGKKTPTEK